MLSMKHLVFKENLVKKLIERYVGLYIVEEVVSKSTMKLKLLAFIKIHLVMRYRELVKKQKMEKPKPVEVEK